MYGNQPSAITFLFYSFHVFFIPLLYFSPHFFVLLFAPTPDPESSVLIAPQHQRTTLTILPPPRADDVDLKF